MCHTHSGTHLYSNLILVYRPMHTRIGTIIYKIADANHIGTAWFHATQQQQRRHGMKTFYYSPILAVVECCHGLVSD
jgi:hypothetical protein